MTTFHQFPLQTLPLVDQSQKYPISSNNTNAHTNKNGSFSSSINSLTSSSSDVNLKDSVDLLPDLWSGSTSKDDEESTTLHQYQSNQSNQQSQSNQFDTHHVQPEPQQLNVNSNLWNNLPSSNYQSNSYSNIEYAKSLLPNNLLINDLQSLPELTEENLLNINSSSSYNSSSSLNYHYNNQNILLNHPPSFSDQSNEELFYFEQQNAQNAQHTHHQQQQQHHHHQHQQQRVQVAPAQVQMPVQPDLNIAIPTTPIEQSNKPSSISSPSSSSSSQSQSQCQSQLNVNTQLYKTELCQSFIKIGICPYGNKCQFAHGENELKIIERSPKWRSKPCSNWSKFGNCRYGNRCCFKHGQ